MYIIISINLNIIVVLEVVFDDFLVFFSIFILRGKYWFFVV